MTKEQEQYIKDNYTTTARLEMARVIGCSKTIVDRFMQKNKLCTKPPKREAMKDNYSAVSFIVENHSKMTIKEIAKNIGYAELTVRRYVDRYLTKEETLAGDLKNYYNYIRNLFDRNKVVVGRVVNTNFKELMALARLKKEGLIQLQREDTGRYTVILN